MLWHQIVGGLIGVVALAGSLYIFIRAEATASKMRERARLYFSPRWIDDDNLGRMYTAFSIRLGAGGGILLGVLMIILGVLGLYA